MPETPLWMQGCEVQSPELVRIKQHCSSPELSSRPQSFPIHLPPAPQTGGLNLLQRPLLSKAIVGFTLRLFCLVYNVKITDIATVEKKCLFSTARSNQIWGEQFCGLKKNRCHTRCKFWLTKMHGTPAAASIYQNEVIDVQLAWITVQESIIKW